VWGMIDGRSQSNGHVTWSGSRTDVTCFIILMSDGSKPPSAVDTSSVEPFNSSQFMQNVLFTVIASVYAIFLSPGRSPSAQDVAQK